MNFYVCVKFCITFHIANILISKINLQSCTYEKPVLHCKQIYLLGWRQSSLNLIQFVYLTPAYKPSAIPVLRPPMP